VIEVYQEKTDWGKILDELRDAGYSGYRVAQALGRSWNTVQGWREHEPKHSDGEALKALHAKLCRRIEA
jgi:hypothetical protein